MNLREIVGHIPLIGVGATTLVFNNNNELLLNLRSDTNTWGIPGGSKELNETLEECAVRELKEETNIDVNDGESKKLEFFSLDNLPELESRAKVIDKIKMGVIII